MGTGRALRHGSLLLAIALWIGQAHGTPDWLDQARALIDARDLDAARNVLERGISENPGLARAHYELGRVLLGLGRPEEALRELETARDLAPDDIDTLWLLATEYENAGRYDQAEAIYGSILRVAPDHPTTIRADHRRRYVVATRLARRGELAEARRLFAELAREDPSDILSLYSLGVAQMLGGLGDEATRTFEQVLDKEPAYVNAWINLARLAQARGRLTEAAGQLRRAIDLSPADSPERESAQTELDLIEAGLLSADGNLQAAYDVYEAILERHPDEVRALAPAARIAQRLGRKSEAIALYRRILERLPTDAPARLALARLEFETGEIESAFADAEAIDPSRLDPSVRPELDRLRQAIERTEAGRRLAEAARRRRIETLEATLKERPDDPEALREIARLELVDRHWEAALPRLLALRDLLPNDPWPHIALATVFDQLGRFADAAAEYAWLVMLERDEAEARRHVRFLRLSLGKALYAAGERRQATEVFEAVLESDPNDLIARFYLGMIHTQEEAMMKAIENYRQIIAIMPSHVGARLNLAAVYARMNREEDALAEYRKLIAASPPDDVVRYARERIREIEKRLGGLTGSLAYATTYDGNSNLNRTRPQEELRSDLGLNLDYRHKMANGLRWRLNLNASYSNFHYSQFDFINLSTTVSADLRLGGTTLLAGVTRRTSRGLITARRSSESNTVFGEALERLSLPHLLTLNPDERVPTNLQIDASLTQFQSTTSRFFDARTLSLSGEIAQAAGDRTMAHLRYAFVRNDNSELIGSDYAYRSHAIAFRIERGYLDSAVVNVQYQIMRLDYLHPDSSTRFTRRRHNLRHTLTLGTNYTINPTLSVSANASWEINDSNLPVGFIINAEDIIEGQQSSSLGDYVRGTIGVGIRMNF